MQSSRFAVITLVLLAATTGSAQMGGRHRPANPGVGSMTSGMTAMDLLVTPDGTIIAEQIGAAMPMSTAKPQVVAISPSGATTWTWSSDNPILFVSLANSLIVVATGDIDEMHDGQAARGSLVALSLSSGKPVWTLPVDGMVLNVNSSPQQIYAVVVRSGSGAPASGLPAWMNGSRTLFAISNSGVILWSKPLVP